MAHSLAPQLRPISLMLCCACTAQAVGDDLIDSIIGGNIPVLTEEEKYNEAVQSSVNRVVAVLTGKEDPGSPYRCARRHAALRYAVLCTFQSQLRRSLAS
jgi:hypothetical protein